MRYIKIILKSLTNLIKKTALLLFTVSKVVTSKLKLVIFMISQLIYRYLIKPVSLLFKKTFFIIKEVLIYISLKLFTILVRPFYLILKKIIYFIYLKLISFFKWGYHQIIKPLFKVFNHMYLIVKKALIKCFLVLRSIIKKINTIIFRPIFLLFKKIFYWLFYYFSKGIYYLFLSIKNVLVFLINRIKPIVIYLSKLLLRSIKKLYKIILISVRFMANIISAVFNGLIKFFKHVFPFVMIYLRKLILGLSNLLKLLVSLIKKLSVELYILFKSLPGFLYLSIRIIKVHTVLIVRAILKFILGTILYGLLKEIIKLLFRLLKWGCIYLADGLDFISIKIREINIFIKKKCNSLVCYIKDFFSDIFNHLLMLILAPILIPSFFMMVLLILVKFLLVSLYYSVLSLINIEKHYEGDLIHINQPFLPVLLYLSSMKGLLRKIKVKCICSTSFKYLYLEIDYLLTRLYFYLFSFIFILFLLAPTIILSLPYLILILMKRVSGDIEADFYQRLRVIKDFSGILYLSDLKVGNHQIDVMLSEEPVYLEDHYVIFKDNTKIKVTIKGFKTSKVYEFNYKHTLENDLQLVLHQIKQTLKTYQIDGFKLPESNYQVKYQKEYKKDKISDGFFFIRSYAKKTSIRVTVAHDDHSVEQVIDLYLYSQARLARLREITNLSLHNGERITDYFDPYFDYKLIYDQGFNTDYRLNGKVTRFNLTYYIFNLDLKFHSQVNLLLSFKEKEVLRRKIKNNITYKNNSYHFNQQIHYLGKHLSLIHELNDEFVSLINQSLMMKHQKLKLIVKVTDLDLSFNYRLKNHFRDDIKLEQISTKYLSQFENDHVDVAIIYRKNVPYYVLNKPYFKYHVIINAPKQKVIKQSLLVYKEQVPFKIHFTFKVSLSKKLVITKTYVIKDRKLLTLEVNDGYID